MRLGHLDRCDRHCCNTLLAADKSHAFVGGGLDADETRIETKRTADVLTHGIAVGKNPGRFRNESAVDVGEACALLGCEFATLGEDLEAGDALDRFIVGREVVADVRQAEGAEHGVRNRMGEDVRIRVTLQSVRVWNLDSTENQFAVFGKLVDVVSDSNTGHCEKRASWVEEVVPGRSGQQTVGGYKAERKVRTSLRLRRRWIVQ